MNFRKLFKHLLIIQEVSNEGRDKKLGKGRSTAVRVNPYNPLSYLTILIVTIIGLMLFGIVGFFEEVECRNPFKWQ